MAFLRRFCQVWSHFHFFGFPNNIFFLQSEVISLASNPQPGGSGPYTYVSQWHDGSVILSHNRFPFCHLLRLAGLQWSYSNLPPHGNITIFTIGQFLVNTAFWIIAVFSVLLITLYLKPICNLFAPFFKQWIFKKLQGSIFQVYVVLIALYMPPNRRDYWHHSSLPAARANT
jgi:hypothetical protein